MDSTQTANSDAKSATTTPTHNDPWFLKTSKNYRFAMLLVSTLALLLRLFPQSQFRSGNELPPSKTPIVGSCAHDYSIEILSVDPIIIYINNFISESEIDHLLKEYTSSFEPSEVAVGHESIADKRLRTSQTAYILNSDPIAICLSRRMKSLLGNLQHMEIEPLQLVKYEATEKYTMHYDWFDQLNNSTHGEDSLNKPFNRLASIFVYLGDACSGGETYFPKVTGVSASTDGDKFSRTDEGTGLLIKPKRGNAVFWKNLHMNGSGDERLAHAGMPVESGVKFGLNVWSKYYPNFSIIGD